MTALEKRTVTALAGLYSFRMLGLFMVLPLLSLYGAELTGSNAFLVGLALGIYGLAQALLQVPLGMLSDRIGRVPVIVGGLVVFGLGSLLAAQADTIFGVILGRMLQGAGAIASTVMALLSDLTSDKQRTKAMAVVGVSIGASFAVALVVGPALAALGGLSLVFYATAALAIGGIFIVLFAVPRPGKPLPLSGGAAGSGVLAAVFSDWNLMRLNLGVFILHFALMALFVELPVTLEAGVGIARDDHWLVYLPVLVLSIAGMVPLMILAERLGRLRMAFLAALGLLLLSLPTLRGGLGLLPFLAGLWLFFAGFNYLEASLPSLVSKTVDARAKGSALGVFSTFQFLGAFAGGAGGGALLEMLGSEALYWVVAALLAAWWLMSLSLRPPPELASLEVRLPEPGSSDTDWVSYLRAAPGVADLMVLGDGNTAYLKVDNAVFDRDILAKLPSVASTARK